MEESRGAVIPMIGEMAPEFHAVTTQGEIHFPKDYHGSWIILFSYLADFTPVCTTELMTLASMSQDFKAQGIELIGLSNDSVYSHIAWLRKIKELSWKDIKHADIQIPLISDVTMEIAKKYGMIHSYNSWYHPIHAVIIIDPEGKIRASLFYPEAIGRNFLELLRIIIALQKSDNDKIDIPAHWNLGDDVIIPPPKTCKAATERLSKISDNMYLLDWFLCFQQSGNEVVNRSEEPEINPYPSMNQMRNRYRYRR